MLTTPRKILCACAVGLAVVCHALTAPAAGPQESAAPAASPEPRALLDQYCVTCHNERLRTAGLLLDTIDDGHVGTSPATWEQVVRKLRSGAMPPAGHRRPDEPTLDAFVTWLENELDREAAAHPDPGRPPIIGSTGSSTATRSATCWLWRSIRDRCCRPTSRTTASTTSPRSSRCRRRCSSGTCSRRGR